MQSYVKSPKSFAHSRMKDTGFRVAARFCIININTLRVSLRKFSLGFMCFASNLACDYIYV